MNEVVRLAEKFAAFGEYWSPKIIGQVNDFHVKLAKFKGEFVWHAHRDEDELFLVVKGRLTMRFRDRSLEVQAGEMIIVPRGVEHLPVADEEAHVLLLEPTTAVNTGDVGGAQTVPNPERI